MHRRIAARRLESYRAARPLVSGTIGLEIGGPSDLFAAGGPLPLYPLLARLDNCNFGRRTIWEGEIHEGPTFRYVPNRQPGWQYIAEATALSPIGADTYDVVLSSHTIEHTANPIRALREWLRVLKAGGGLVLVVPDRNGTFDHRRPLTTLAHLMEDAARGTTEEDVTHLPEILELHDLSRDPGAGNAIEFAARSRRNSDNRCLHHHVFDSALVTDMLRSVGLRVDVVEQVPPFHIIAIARKGVSPG